MDLIFKRSHERLNYLHQSIDEHINEAKRTFIQESTPEILNDLSQIKCPHQRIEILEKVGLIKPEAI
jgi:3-methyladenine DNA glycosylase AlkC